MRHDDFFDDDENYCDEEAFSGSLHFLGTCQIDQLFRYRDDQCPDMADAVFFGLIEVLLEPFEEFLSPDQVEELWGFVYMWHHERARERNPRIKYGECERQVRQHLSGTRKLNPRSQAEGKPAKKRHK
ncbi:MAG: hypothetical protein ABSH35_15390 [Isosphaeraceae bacterium]|jgi:hypothetical protein